ncbi:MAG: hypothetical protein IKE76_02930 [Clostridia bacterium]|nr:hypothetical protein [Clostridia bacterium]
MRKGTTSTGFAYEFEEERLDDMRFVDVLAVVVDPEAPQFDKISGVSRLLAMLLGEDMKKALYEHIGARHDGRVPRAELEAALEEIMAGTGKDAEKNS